MDKLVISGGHPLHGEVKVSGSKNAALPLMAACLLTDEPCTLTNLPDLVDITTMTELLTYLGVGAERDGNRITIEARKPEGEAPYDIVRKMRASYYVLGPLLSRFREAKISLPGGCAIGARPIDLHIKGMEKLGAEVAVEEGYVHAKAAKLEGSDIHLRGTKGPSVGATINVMMAAVLAEGQTKIIGAAAEPEVCIVAGFLNKMGAKIAGYGTPEITIQGVKRLSGVEFENMPDRIEAGTYAVAATITRGRIILRNAPSAHMGNIIQPLLEAGGEIEASGKHLTVSMMRRPSPLVINTAPYPGFPTDMQAQFMAWLSLGEGTSIVAENIFENRFMQAMELQRMGAEITIQGTTAVINGTDHLSGAEVMASDLRASAALVLAGLAAKGTTTVSRIYHLDRGYEGLEQKLASVGGEIKRVSVPGDE
ncbi:UDP-N-acetylglucosamine 1-carboxyvinyltransferase [candidate division WOR-3 bacterium]|uniref:UDP-N-acetylglucosamine 1-carboxyvinyltransferase n=1 Tax=candidate division WOR-3 bacterium TaxID=2052148 RepID=A0A9D5KAQ9_UNCW3|nr:UDP-N-acetylglucosamine 1-carboxyvinyltransferase [candidate division WOR-3 bacterium]MBD3365289.1 UDP-N-acetylglucosamine 1-carboxyvinyltransferase [candidate division WOR-3 bacterium]